MKRFTISLLTLMLMITPLALSSTAHAMQEADPLVQQGGGRFWGARPASKLDIMRRVIVKSINREMTEHYEPGVKQGAGLIPHGSVFPKEGEATVSVSTLGNAIFSYAGESRGHHIPGHGAVFSLQVKVPVVMEQDEEEPDAAKEEVEDLWTEATDEAEGRTNTAFGTVVRSGAFNRLDSTGGYAQPGNLIIDPEGIDLAIASVSKAVAKYGQRLEEVAEDESIIVVLDILAGSTHNTRTNSNNQLGAWSYSFSTAFGNTIDAQQVILEYSLKDLKRYGGGEGDMPGLSARTKITRRGGDDEE